MQKTAWWDTGSPGAIRGGLTEQVPFEQRLEGGEVAGHEEILGKHSRQMEQPQAQGKSVPTGQGAVRRKRKKC